MKTDNKKIIPIVIITSIILMALFSSISPLYPLDISWIKVTVQPQSIPPSISETPIPGGGFGSLVITSIPTSATVYIDDFPKGNTPLYLSLETGFYNIDINMNGYQTYSKSVEIIKDIETRIDAVLISTGTTTPTGTGTPTGTETFPPLYYTCPDGSMVTNPNNCNKILSLETILPYLFIIIGIIVVIFLFKRR